MKAFVALKAGIEQSEALRRELLGLRAQASRPGCGAERDRFRQRAKDSQR